MSTNGLNVGIFRRPNAEAQALLNTEEELHPRVSLLWSLDLKGFISIYF